MIWLGIKLNYENGGWYNLVKVINRTNKIVY
jgi:hypothetical protein